MAKLIDGRTREGKRAIAAAMRGPLKPRMTARTVGLLRGLIGYAESEADTISDGTADQQQEAKDVREACEWLRGLCMWHEAKRAARK